MDLHHRMNIQFASEVDDGRTRCSIQPYYGKIMTAIIILWGNRVLDMALLLCFNLYSLRLILSASHCIRHL